MRALSLVPPLLALLCAACDRSPLPSERPVTTLNAPAGCDPQQGCLGGDGSVVLEFSFAAPPRAMKPFPVRLQVNGGDPVESVMIAFSMPGMDMGLNRYAMVKGTAGDWNAEVTLPICISGRSDWVAGVEIVTAGRRLRWNVPFVLEK